MAPFADILDHARDVTEPLSATWRELAWRAGLPYATPEWMLAFWRHVHEPKGRLAIVVVRDRDEVLGIAPLYANRGGLGAVEYHLLGAGIGQRTALLARPGVEADVARVVA